MPEMEVTKEMSAQYVKNIGNKCPVCKGTDLTGGDRESDNAEIWWFITCEGCGATWEEIYILSGIDDLTTS